MGIGDMFSKILSGGKDSENHTETEAPGQSTGEKEVVSTSVDDGAASAHGASSESQATVTKEVVMHQLSDIYDPEIPIDIVNLGLIYEVEIEGPKVHVQMTMTAPGCPSSAQIAQEAQFVIEELPGVEEAWIEIVWDPPWDPGKMSEDARLSMGM